MSQQTYKILLVEDNPGDVMLVEESLQAAKILFQMTHCETVNSALAMISGYRAGDPDIPDLLLLDYNLPGGEARQVLDAAVANTALTNTKKAVITSSLSP